LIPPIDKSPLAEGDCVELGVLRNILAEKGLFHIWPYAANHSIEGVRLLVPMLRCDRLDLAVNFVPRGQDHLDLAEFCGHLVVISVLDFSHSLVKSLELMY
jgi:hypothetical protein